MEIKMREYYQSELMALRNKIMNFGQTLAWKEELLLLIENLRHSKEVLEEEVKVLQKEYL